MARHLYLGDIAAWTLGLGTDETALSGLAGQHALLIPGATITLWNAASGGSQITDLLDMLSTPITSVTSDSSGNLPQIQGPDTTPETTSMWADGNGGAGPRVKVVATDLGDSIPGGLAATITTLTTLSGLIPVVWLYDSVAAAWNPRPAAAGSLTVVWIGPSPPPIGGSPEYARDGVDIFVDVLP